MPREVGLNPVLPTDLEFPDEDPRTSPSRRGRARATSSPMWPSGDEGHWIVRSRNLRIWYREIGSRIERFPSATRDGTGGHGRRRTSMDVASIATASATANAPSVYAANCQRDGSSRSRSDDSMRGAHESRLT